jgi:hypothetical protein
MWITQDRYIEMAPFTNHVSYICFLPMAALVTVPSMLENACLQKGIWVSSMGHLGVKCRAIMFFYGVHILWRLLFILAVIFPSMA